MDKDQLTRDVALMWASLNEKLRSHVVLWNNVYLVYSDEYIVLTVQDHPEHSEPIKYESIDEVFNTMRGDKHCMGFVPMEEGVSEALNEKYTSWHGSAGEYIDINDKKIRYYLEDLLEVHFRVLPSDKNLIIKKLEK